MSTFFRRLFWGLLISGLLLSATGLLLWLNADQIKQYLLNQINRELMVEVSVKGPVDLTFFSSFPKLNLTAKEVMVSSGTPGRKTPFLQVGELSVSVKIPELLRKKVNLSGIKAKDGKVDLFIPKKGRASYEVFKPTEGKSDFELSLRHIALERCKINYRHAISNSSFEGKVQSFVLDGNLQQDQSKVKVKTKFRLNQSDLELLKPIQRKWMVASGNLYYNKPQNLLRLNQFTLSINQLSFSADGEVAAKGKKVFVDFEFKHEGKEPMEVIALLPDSLQQRTKGMQCKGTYAIWLKVKGVKSGKTKPAIQVKGSISNAELAFPSGSKIEDINATLNYAGPAMGSDTLHFHLTGARQEDNQLQMKALVIHLNDPWLDVEAKGVFHMGNLLKLAGVSPSIHADGKLDVSAFRFKGLYQSIQYDHLSELSLYARMKLQDVEFTADEVTYGDMQGDLTLVGDSLGIHRLSGKFLGTTAEVNGSILHPIAYATSIRKGGKSTHPLDIRAVVKAPRLDINRLISAYKKEKRDDEKRAEVSQVVNFIGSLQLDITDLIYREFNAKQVVADVVMEGNRLVLNQLKANVFHGSVNGSGSFTALPDNSMSIGIDITAKDLDLQEMLKQNRNFDQTVLTDKNIKGYLSAEGKAGFLIMPKTGLDKESITGEMNFTVDQGELVEFKPLQSLSTFIRVEELARIRFQKLSNQVLINHGKIMIPQMEVNSNAVNLQLKGEHDFKNNIDYRVKVNLRKVLANKLRRNHTDQSFIESDPYEGANLLLRISGNIASPLVQYDRQSVKNKLKEDFRKEREEIRNLFKKENKPREKTSEEEHYFNTGNKMEFLDLEKP